MREEGESSLHPDHWRNILTKCETSSTVSSNATAPNLPGPGRIINLLLDALGRRLDAFLNMLAAQNGMGPEVVARDIRLARQHQDMTVIERYSTSLDQLSTKERKYLRKRCRWLLKYARSPVLSVQLVALKELMAFSVEDPVIRALLMDCRLDALHPKYREPELLLTSARALSCVRDTETHTLWSSTTLRLVDGNGNVDYRSLQHWHSIWSVESSFIAARYLAHLYQLEKTAHRSLVRPELFLRYIAAASRNSEDVEWSNFNECLKYIYENMKDFGAGFQEFQTLSYFTDRSHHEFCKGFFANIVREIRHVPDFYVYLTMPRITIRTECGINTSDVVMTGIEVSDWILDERATTCVKFLSDLTDSEVLDVHLSCIRSFDASTRKALTNTILTNELFIAYCHLVCYSDATSLPVSIVCRQNWRRVLSAAVFLAEKQHVPEFSVTALFLAVKFASFSRYCKLAMCYGGYHIPKPFLFSEDFARQVNDAIQEDRFIHSPVSPPILILRIKIDGAIHQMHSLRAFCGTFLGLSSEGEFGDESRGGQASAIFRLLEGNRNQSLRFDVMCIPDSDAYIVKLKNDVHAGPFSVTGHYPLLAGYDLSGNAKFVVQEGLRGNSYGTIVDGASTAILTLNSGDTTTAKDFYVLALRHNPGDVRSSYVQSSIGNVVDATGLLGWRSAWPDVDYGLSELLDVDDFRQVQRTNSVLNNLAQSSEKDISI